MRGANITLLDVVWTLQPGSKSLQKNVICQIRAALADDAKARDPALRGRR